MQPSLIVAEPELAKQFFQHPKIEKVVLKMTRFVEWFIGYSVSRANGADWKRMRQFMDPAFVDLSKYLNIFISKSQYCMQKLQNEAQGNATNTVQIYDKMQRMVFFVCVFIVQVGIGYFGHVHFWIQFWIFG